MVCIKEQNDTGTHEKAGTVRVTEKFPFRFIGVPFLSYTLCVFSYRFRVYFSILLPGGPIGSVGN